MADNLTPTKPAAIPAPKRPEEKIKPPSTLLMGNPGGGKTYAISTLLAAGLEVFVIVVEANGLDTLLDAVHVQKLDISKLHWCYIPPTAMSWAAMEKVGLQINNKTYEELANTSPGAFQRDECKQYFKLISACANFHDDRTGQDFGDVTLWDDTRALVIDSMSGLNDIIRQTHLGHKPNPHMGEWGTIMNVELNFLKKLTSDMDSFFVVTCHVDREKDEVSGGTIQTSAALGSKNAPQIARLFSEIVFTRRVGPTGAARWSTADPAMVLKNRGLKFSGDLDPDFRPLVASYRRRKEQAAQKETSQP